MSLAERMWLPADTPAPTRPRPLLVAVAGDSASGKSTLARGIEWILGVERVTRICVDDYHRFDRRTRESLGITALQPEANDLDRMAEHLERLSLGQAIDKPVYDHASGELLQPERVEPRDTVVVEGLLPLGTRRLRDRFDVSVYLEPEEELRHRWKIERDCDERGYDILAVVDDLRRRELDAEAFVRPQREVADIVVAFHRGTSLDPFEDLGARILFRRSLLDPPLHGIVASLGSGDHPAVRLVHDDRSLDTGVQAVEVDGACPPRAGAAIEERIWRRLRPEHRLRRDRIGRSVHASGQERRSEALAITQLLIVAHVVDALRGPFER
jgi:phosphoribulokinase